MTVFHIQNACPLCGAPKSELPAEEEAVCSRCGNSFETDEACPNGHHVCFACQRALAGADIVAHCLKSNCTDPTELALELMRLPKTPMHGPVHHLLMPAALLTAWHNATEKPQLAESLAEAEERSGEVPGGACGYWGICGAAVGAGIAYSIATEASPFSEESWGCAGTLVANCAQAISAVGGPRCCKRDAFLALAAAVPFFNQHLGTAFPAHPGLKCIFFANNEDCKKKACPFFPTRQA